MQETTAQAVEEKLLEPGRYNVILVDHMQSESPKQYGVEIVKVSADSDFIGQMDPVTRTKFKEGDVIILIDSSYDPNVKNAYNLKTIQEFNPNAVFIPVNN